MRIVYLNLILISTLLLSSCKDSCITVSTNDEVKTVEFPDGSIAFLNASSSVRYDEDFTSRMVSQTGEVFYEVKKEDEPFVVITEVGMVQVLGTKFNVNSRNDQLEVDVEEGSVEVKADRFLQKIESGQKALVDDINEGIEIGKSEFQYKKWMREFMGNVEKFAKDAKHDTQGFRDESKKLGKGLKSKIKKLNG